MSDFQPRVEVDSEVKSTYLYLSNNPVNKTKQIYAAKNVIILIDFDKDKNVIGIEVLQQ
jgi:uncharacterized protein YuzE